MASSGQGDIKHGSARSSSVPMLAIAPMTGRQPRAYRWVKTECGRAKYDQLASPTDLLSRLRLGWFVAIAALRDWRLPDPDQP